MFNQINKVDFLTRLHQTLHQLEVTAEFFFCAALTDYRHLEVATLYTRERPIAVQLLAYCPIPPGPPDDNAFLGISRIRGCPFAD